MKSFIAFSKKELIESVRTYKLMIVLSVFLLFGMLNPITAKITPELLKEFMPEGIIITLPSPSSIDS
jgi:ABC-2 type transport system permease protein